VQSGADVVAVVRFVHDGGLDGTRLGNRSEDLLHHGGIVLLTGRQNESEGSLLVGGGQVKLGAETAPTPAKPLLLLPPFWRAAPAACGWARMIVLSTNKTFTASKTLPGKRWNKACQTPRFCQRRKRWYTASQAPKQVGKSRQGIPVRARY